MAVRFSHYGEQPAARVIREKGFTYVGLARELGISSGHLYNAVNGNTIPSSELRDLLPAALATPLSRLFNADVLEQEHDKRGRPRKSEAGAA
jgi:transcriptional regulator with XRE-family HTH domain